MTTFVLTVFCSFVFSALLIGNLEFFIQKFWLNRLAIVGLSAKTNLNEL